MRDTIRKALDLIENRRKQQRLSIRRAAERAGLSEATWRQLVAGEVRQAGQVIERLARRDQVLDMAAAVEALEEVADALDATEGEIEGTLSRVQILDPAQEEIMSSRHLSPSEKLILLDSLRQVRNGRTT